MKNSNIVLKSNDESSAKAVAGTIGLFLESKGVSLPRTQVLDLVGVMCGCADWRSLKAYLETQEALVKAQPKSLTYDEFVKRFKPVKNTNNPNVGMDGFGFSTSGMDYEYVQQVLKTDPGRVWTLVNTDATSWLVSGHHYVNREMYVITHVSLDPDAFYEIAYGHSEDETRYQIRVCDSEGEVVFSDERYADSSQDAIDQVQTDIDDAAESLHEDDKVAYVFVEPMQ